MEDIGEVVMKVIESVLGFLPSQFMQESQRANYYLEQLIRLVMYPKRIQ